MPCAPCAQARRQFVHSAARFDIRGAAQAVTYGATIIAAKARGVDPATVMNIPKATPYRRPSRPNERTK